MATTPGDKISSSDALAYWNSIPTTVDGMLGGYPQISRIDLKGSANFLAKLRREHPSLIQEAPLRGVDCGAGIGRVTAGFLSVVCDVVDIVEPVEKFANAIKDVNMAGKGAIGQVYIMGLESWEPEERYDLIWNQWCLGHLKDEQLVDYLLRCKNALTADGIIVMKENMSTEIEGQDVFDELDSSVTRSNEKFKELIKEAGLKCIKTELQRGFPKGLYPVRFYALKP